MMQIQLAYTDPYDTSWLFSWEWLADVALFFWQM
jgi:hypothetical protein